MTLLDAPVFDERKERRRSVLLYCSVAAVFVLFVCWWLVAGRPVDWPWHWNDNLFGRLTVNRFLSAVEQNDLTKAYGIWMHDPDWQKHPEAHKAYSFDRVEQDFSSQSPDNEYGAFHSHKIAESCMCGGNTLLVAILINGRKSGALNLAYDPNTKSLNFSPPGVELYLGP